MKERGRLEDFRLISGNVKVILREYHTSVLTRKKTLLFMEILIPGLDGTELIL
jgi:hypothetical protein